MTNKFYTLLICFVFAQSAIGQNLFIEGGLGIGKITGREHRGGKAEIHVNIFKSLNVEEFGIDISTGGNFIPSEGSIIEDNTEVISSADSRFNSAVFLYRFPLITNIYLEPRIGYASLSSFIHTDEKKK